MANFTTQLLAETRSLRPWRDKAIARQLEEVLALPLACCAFADAERDVPKLVLNRLQMLANGGGFPLFAHPELSGERGPCQMFGSKSRHTCNSRPFEPRH